MTNWFVYFTQCTYIDEVTNNLWPRNWIGFGKSIDLGVWTRRMNGLMIRNITILINVSPTLLYKLQWFQQSHYPQPTSASQLGRVLSTSIAMLSSFLYQAIRRQTPNANFFACVLKRYHLRRRVNIIYIGALSCACDMGTCIMPSLRRKQSSLPRYGAGVSQA